MSNYNRLTKNPETGEFENATWIDDFYGNHHYGVRFPDGTIVDPRAVELETRDRPITTNKKKETKGDNIKMIQEVNRRKIELIIHAAFIVGFLAHSEGRTYTHPDNSEEIKNLIDLISKETI